MPNLDLSLNFEATNAEISIPGIVGPRGPEGIVHTGELDFRYYSINNPSGFIRGLDLTNYITGIDNILYTTGNQIKSGRLIIGNDSISIVDPNSQYTLSLQTNSPGTWLEILNNSGANQGVFFGIEGNDFEQYNWQGGDIKFFTSENFSDGIERLRIKNDGKVGIGTNSPSEKLEVDGNIKADGASFDTVQIRNKKLSSYNYINSNFTFGDTYINIANSSNNITGTLPSEITSGINYYVKNLNTGVLLITGTNQRTIDGFSTINLYKNESLQLLGVNNIGYTGWVALNADNGVS
jgi:hypothetical protein